MSFAFYGIVGISLILLESLLIGGLLWQRARRMKVETDLAVTNDRLRLALEAGKSVGWNFEVRSGQDQWFGDLQNMFGISADNYSGNAEDFYRSVHPEDRKGVRKAVANARQSRNPYVAEFRIVRADGAVRWITASGKFYYAKSGDAERMLGMAVDITDRKLAEETLRESEARFRDLAEQSHTTHWEVDPQGLFTYVSHVSQASWGYRPDEVVGRMHFYDIHPEEGRKAFKAAVFAVVERKQPFRDVVHAMETKDGRLAWGSTNGIPLLNADGTLRGYRGSCTDVTDRKLAEDVRRRYAAIVESSDDAIIGADTHGIITDWNKGAEKLYGFSANEAIGSHVSFISPADRPEEGQEILNKVISGEPVRHNETIRRRKDGTTVGVSLTVSSIVDDDGRIVGASGIARDTTERRQAEAQLRESEEQFRTLAEAIPQLCWMARGDGHGFWNNQRWYSYTGTTPEQMEGWGWQSVHDPQTLPTVLERWNVSILKGEPFDMVYPLRGADGVFRSFLTRVMPLKDADGRVVRWFGTCTDVTELRDAHEKRYRQLFENMSEGIAYCRMLFDDSGRPTDFICLDVNTAFPRLTGLKDAVGKRMTELIPGIRESNPELFETCGRVVLTGQPEKLEVEIRSLGTWLSTSVHSPERDHFMAVFDNITERKRSEERLLRAEKLTSVGRMAAAIAHEINNPLDAVMNLLFLVGTTKDLPESVRHLLETADDELKRVAHITRQSLGFYHESSAPTLTPVSAVLNSAVDLVRSRIKLKQAIIEKQFDGDVQITAISGELRQVFSNLLSNSLDAINERGVIKLRVSAGRHRIRVTIADNGKGVPKSMRRRVFEPFFSTKGAVGTGLGLWVSQQIIEKHGGTIRVRSSSDGLRRGTTFSVALPLGPTQPEGQLTVTLGDVGNKPRGSSQPADRPVR